METDGQEIPLFLHPKDKEDPKNKVKNYLDTPLPLKKLPKENPLCNVITKPKFKWKKVANF